MSSPHAGLPGGGDQARRHVIGRYEVELFIYVAMYRAQQAKTRACQETGGPVYAVGPARDRLLAGWSHDRRSHDARRHLMTVSQHRILRDRFRECVRVGPAADQPVPEKNCIPWEIDQSARVQGTNYKDILRLLSRRERERERAMTLKYEV